MQGLPQEAPALREVNPNAFVIGFFQRWPLCTSLAAIRRFGARSNTFPCSAVTDICFQLSQDFFPVGREIFRLHGEAYFRDREHEICASLSQRERLIVSAGGGALTFQRNIDALRKGCVLVLIDVTPEVIYERLAGDTTRPLLQCEDKMAAIRELYAKRDGIYRAAADVTVNGNQPKGFVALDIMKAVGIL